MSQDQFIDEISNASICDKMEWVDYLQYST